jgi:hypothetical protein|nr:MAG TPA: hypothetical protein [Bacteriophage sp.]
MDSNLKVGSNNAGLFIGNTEILGGVTVNYEDGFFNDPGSACIIVNNSQETKSFNIDNNTVNVASNSISFLYNYSNWKISTNTDIIYDFRFGDTDNGEANDTITAKANDVLFNFTGYGSYLVLVIKE